MKKTVYTLLAGTLPLLFLLGCGRSSTESKSMEQLYAEKGLPVRAVRVTAGPPESSYSAYAVLTGIRESSASASVSDKVDEVHYAVGDMVEKDAVIITFPADNPGARYTQAKVNVEHMRATLARMRSLYESGGISRQEYDNTAARYEVASADYDAARQTVHVRAPISGTITRIAVRESDNVRPGDALFTVARTHELKAQIWVPETRVTDIRQGDRAEAHWNGRALRGNVTQVDLSLNQRRQAFGVQVWFDNRDQAVLSGVNAEIIITPADTTPVLTIAREHLFREKDSYYVYKIINGGAVKQAVTAGRTRDLYVEILDGLQAGDLIISEGVSLAADGQKVRIIE